MLYLLLKKNSLRTIMVVDVNDINDRLAIKQRITDDDLELFTEQDIDIFEPGFQYQNEGVEFIMCATQKEAEVS